MQDTKNLMATAASPVLDEKAQRTIVHEILESKLTSPEKSLDRVFDDVTTITGTGFETTASVLRVVLFHVFNDTEILQRIRAELASINADPSEVELKTLEQLPYLTSTLMEGLRLTRLSPHVWHAFPQIRISSTAAGEYLPELLLE